MDPGRRSVPQGSAEVCRDRPDPSRQPGPVRGGHVPALEHHGLSAEVGECPAGPRGQAEDIARAHEGTGAEE